jgi:hypothetical protein
MMARVVAGMCVYVCHPPAPLSKSFFIRANLLRFFFQKEVGLFHATGEGA